MIISIGASDPGFQGVTFTPGLNVVLADRTHKSSDKDSRNGLGKSTLLEIIHFMLGSTPRPSHLLRSDHLKGWEFSIELEILGSRVSARRRTDDPRTLEVESDSLVAWSNLGLLNAESRSRTFSNIEWINFLNRAMFNIAIDKGGGKYRPTFRSLISYFVRSGSGAYLDPFRHFENQKEWDQQVNTAFLLGLNWAHASEWQLLKDRDSDLKQITRSANSGLVSELIGSLGALETARIRLSQEVRRHREELATFQVHPQYREIELSANDLTTQIRELVNSNSIDEGLRRLYIESLGDEDRKDFEPLVRLYEEAGAIFQEHSRLRLEDVVDFHNKVISNRRSYLQGEVGKLTEAISHRHNQIQPLSNRRAELLAVLHSHGALDEYNQLQQLLLAKESELRDLERRIGLWQNIERQKSAVKIDRERLRLDARSDLSDRENARWRAIEYFNSNSEELYDSPGELIIDLDDNGFDFRIKIERSGSQGIDRMKIDCYDLVLAQIWSDTPTGPGFLVHDSTMFDGVDERQRSRAIELAEKRSRQYGFQYICCLNTDVIPWEEFSEGFDFNSFTRLTLTDATEEGGLLGFRIR